MIRRGFTVIELSLALVLGSIVVGAAVAMISLLYNADRFASAQFDESVNLANAQQTMRNIIRTLVAAPSPEQKVKGTAGADGTTTGDGSKSDPAQAEKDAAKAAANKAGVLGGNQKNKDKAGSSSDEAPELRAPRLEIRYDSNGSGPALGVLEAVIYESPVPPYPLAQGTVDVVQQSLIRGIVEGVRIGEQEWGLQWRQLQPPARPVLIARGLRGWKWQVLPRLNNEKKTAASHWEDVYVCAYPEQFPTAVGLILETTRGTRVNWLFDVAAHLPWDDDEVVDER